jgi:uncharacterized membrane protein
MRKYTGYTYMKKLERCLRKMPYEERLDAVNYYSEYLADAGPEREQEVITRLGPPQRLAAEIRADAALRELNAKAEIAESVKARRKAKKAEKGSGRAGTDYAYGNGAQSGAYGSDVQGNGAQDAGAYGGSHGSGAQDTGAYGGSYGNGVQDTGAYGDSYGNGAQDAGEYGGSHGSDVHSGGAYDGSYGSDVHGGGAYAGAYESDGRHGKAGSASYTVESEYEKAESPKMGESFSAAGLGAIGMLSMPVARPLAVLACVLGIIGLVMSAIVVAVLYAVAGAFMVSGVFVAVVSFILAPQDISVTVFFAGGGLAFIGAGLLIGALNYMLGRAIFKGIANLSGRIRHKRVKVRKDIFNYTYTGADRGYPYTYGGAGNYTAQPDARAGYPYSDRYTGAGSYTAQPDARADYPYTGGNTGAGNYTERPGAGEGYPYTDGSADAGSYTAQPNEGSDYPYTEGDSAPGNYTAQSNSDTDYPYTDESADDSDWQFTDANEADSNDDTDAQNARGVRVEDRPTL